MATYRLTADPPESYFSWRWKAGLILAGLVCIVVATPRIESEWSALFPNAPDVPHALMVLSASAEIFILGMFIVAPSAIKSRSSFRLEVAQDRISRHSSAGKDSFLLRDEIIGFVERKGKGIMLLANDSWRRMYIPGDLEGHSDFRAELQTMGIPEISSDKLRHTNNQIRVPLLICAVSLVCLFLARNVSEVAICSAVLLASAGWIVYRSRKRIEGRASFGAGLVCWLFIVQHRLVIVWHNQTADRLFVYLDAAVLFVFVFIWLRERLGILGAASRNKQ